MNDIQPNPSQLQSIQILNGADGFLELSTIAPGGPVERQVATFRFSHVPSVPESSSVVALAEAPAETLGPTDHRGERRHLSAIERRSMLTRAAVGVGALALVACSTGTVKMAFSIGAHDMPKDTQPVSYIKMP